MLFERESFVLVCISPTFVCTSKGSEIQSVSIFAQYLYSELSQFSRYRNGTNDIRKKIVCIRLYFFYFRFYLKRFEDTAISKFPKKMRQEGKLVIFKDIEMGPTAKGEAARGETNDSLSNAVDFISIS